MTWRRAVRALVLVTATLVSVAGGMALAATGTPAAAPAEAAATTSGPCIAPVPFMRRNHMEILKHDRRVTVHQGVRVEGHRLEDCITCHAVKGENGQAVPISDSRHFCNRCHGAAAVSIDCFSCHRSTPEPAGREARR